MLIENAFDRIGVDRPSFGLHAMGDSAAEPKAIAVVEVAGVAHAMPDGAAVMNLGRGIGFHSRDVARRHDRSADEEFADLAARCGGVLWLVPEPASRWGTGDSALPLYLPSIDVLVEATDLAGLAAGVAELRRRL